MAEKSMLQLAQKAAQAARSLAVSETEQKNRALESLAAWLRQNKDRVLAAGDRDVEAAAASGLGPHMLDRLRLNQERVEEMAQAVERVAALPDPVGQLEDRRQLPSGLIVSRLRIPLGLIAFICEARPGALVEAASLAIKSSNALIVKCGKEMASVAAVLAEALKESLRLSGLDPEALTALASIERQSLRELLQYNQYIDLVIPRGGEGLIRFVSENSRIPVLMHFKGVCHLYVDEEADLALALKLLINGKTQRPSTCNSLEALLVHQSRAAEFLPQAAAELAARGVRVKADPRALALMPQAETAEDGDWGREFLNLTLAVRVLDSYQAALDHIAAYGSRHTEVIVTDNAARAAHFQRAVEAGCVMVNASSRLNDGGCLGLGAEIGISTTKLHAYGPMGLRELTTTRFIVEGRGQTR